MNIEYLEDFLTKSHFYNTYLNFFLIPNLFIKLNNLNERISFSRKIDKMESWESHVQEALDDVKRGQHLRFINKLYRTEEVCFEAVKYQLRQDHKTGDIYSVPVGNIIHVIQKIKEKYLDTFGLYDYLDKVLNECWSNPDNLFDKNTELLIKYKVKTYDELLEKLYNEKKFIS